MTGTDRTTGIEQQATSPEQQTASGAGSSPDIATADSPHWDPATQEHLGRWNRLVSTTNWEKGRIIHEWRTAMQSTGAPVAEWSDEAWSRRVGNVSPQHVGRLRRVHERFGETFQEYAGLFWSHFQASIDWDDAEMWLEGASANGWSVSQMRLQRWEAMGGPHSERPDGETPVAEPDEDVDPSLDGNVETVNKSVGDVRGLDDEDADSDDDIFDSDSSDDDDHGADDPASAHAPADAHDVVGPPSRPFEGMPSLPADLQEAVESMKLAILSHRLTKWDEVSPGDVLASLDALKQLTLAPLEG